MRVVDTSAWIDWLTGSESGRKLARELTEHAIIYATAQHRNADLLTCDRHFANLPGEIVLEKT